MTYPARTPVMTVAVPLLLSLAYASLGSAQVRPMTRDTAPTRPAAMPMASSAAKMTSSPHRALAMAFGASIATFARVVNTDASQSQTVNVELARPAVIEMRRSFDQMTVHHQAQMATMGVAMRTPMTKDSAAAMSRPARRDSMTKPMSMPMPASSRRDSARLKPMTPPSPSDSTMSHPATMPMSTDSSRMTGMGDMQGQLAALEKHLGMLESEVNAPAPNAARVVEHTAEIMKICGDAMRMPSDSMGKPRAPGAP